MVRTVVCGAADEGSIPSLAWLCPFPSVRGFWAHLAPMGPGTTAGSFVTASRLARTRLEDIAQAAAPRSTSAPAGAGGDPTKIIGTRRGTALELQCPKQQ